MPVKVLIPQLLGAAVQALVTRKAKSKEVAGEELDSREVSIPRILATAAVTPSLVELGSSGAVLSESVEVLIFQAFAALGALAAKLVIMYLEGRKAQD